MKYKLLKKIEGYEQEIGDIIELNIDLIVSAFTVHNLLLNGTIEKVEENTRWRSGTYNVYYYVDFNEFKAVAQTEVGSTFDDKMYESGNYFQTESQAQKVADKIKQLLQESHE